MMHATGGSSGGRLCAAAFLALFCGASVAAVRFMDAFDADWVGTGRVLRWCSDERAEVAKTRGEFRRAAKRLPDSLQKKSLCRCVDRLQPILHIAPGRFYTYACHMHEIGPQAGAHTVLHFHSITSSALASELKGSAAGLLASKLASLSPPVAP